MQVDLEKKTLMSESESTDSTKGLQFQVKHECELISFHYFTTLKSFIKKSIPPICSERVA